MAVASDCHRGESRRSVVGYSIGNDPGIGVDGLDGLLEVGVRQPAAAGSFEFDGRAARDSITDIVGSLANALGQTPASFIRGARVFSGLRLGSGFGLNVHFVLAGL